MEKNPEISQDSNKSLNTNTEDKNILENVPATEKQILNTKKEGLIPELRIIKILQKKLDIEMTKEIKEINNEKFTFDAIKIILFPLLKIQPIVENTQIPVKLDESEPKDSQNFLKKLNKTLSVPIEEIKNYELENGNLIIKGLNEFSKNLLTEKQNLKDAATTNLTSNEETKTENNENNIIKIESDQNFCKKSHEKNSENKSDISNEKISENISSFESKSLKGKNSINTLSLENDSKNQTKSFSTKEPNLILKEKKKFILNSP